MFIYLNWFANGLGHAVYYWNKGLSEIWRVQAWYFDFLRIQCCQIQEELFISLLYATSILGQTFESAHFRQYRNLNP
jgi:hypothetical protein